MMHNVFFWFKCTTCWGLYLHWCWFMLGLWGVLERWSLVQSESSGRLCLDCQDPVSELLNVRTLQSGVPIHHSPNIFGSWSPLFGSFTHDAPVDTWLPWWAEYNPPSVVFFFFSKLYWALKTHLNMLQCSDSFIAGYLAVSEEYTLQRTK